LKSRNKYSCFNYYKCKVYSFEKIKSMLPFLFEKLKTLWKRGGFYERDYN